ncbi:MAG: PAS domain S-box protein [Haloplanus sp.]
MSESIRVLLVDDAADLAAVAAKLLERENDRFDVVTETDAAAALDRLEAASVDCLVADYRMPETDGLELLRIVRERWPDLPVILFTGEGNEEIASEAVSAGATDYVRKESGADQYALLANRIVRAVANRRSQERAARLGRIRDLAHDVNRALVRADDREAVERSACERLVAADPYLRAAIMTVDGGPKGYDVTVRTSASASGAGDAGWDVEAVRTAAAEHSPAVTDEPTPIAAVPLDAEDEEYGVLAVVATDPDAIGELELDLIEELGADVARALRNLDIRADLRESEEKYRRLVEQNLVGVYLIQDGEFEYVNPRLAAMFGYTQEEFLTDVTPFDIVIEDDHETLRENLRRRESGEVDDLRYTLRGTRKDGTEIEFEVHGGRIDYRGEPAIMGTLLDVTERKRRERELERSRTEYRELFESFPDAVFVGTFDEGFVAVNDAAVDRLGYSREELLSMRPVDLDPEMDEESIAARVETFSRDRITSFETVHRTKDGEDIPVEVNATLIPYRGETAILSTARDITERVERERELRKQNERLEEVASVISHDLRNPLNVALGRLNWAREDCDSDHLDDVSNALDRMNRLIDDLLTLTGRRDELTTAPVALDAVVDRCWRNVATDRASLHCDVERTIRADESRLAQVFENLIRNAVEHGSTSSRPQADDSVDHGSTSSRPQADDSVEHGSTSSRPQADDSVEHGSTSSRPQADDDVGYRSANADDADVDATDDEAGVTIRVGSLPDGFYVEDDGDGIPPDVRERIFDAGYSTNEKGTGLGLAIVRDVIEAHGWGIEVVPGQDGGARFEITGVETAE